MASFSSFGYALGTAFLQVLQCTTEQRSMPWIRDKHNDADLRSTRESKTQMWLEENRPGTREKLAAKLKWTVKRTNIHSRDHNPSVDRVL